MTRPLHIGTSGWQYPAWRDRFYQGLPRSQWLSFAASRFTGLEINSTFYGTPREESLRRWRKAVAGDFRFAMKGHRFVTHRKRLKDVDESVRRVRDSARPLGKWLAAVVWQLPGDLRCDPGRLDGFLRALRCWTAVPHAMEFRHSSWFTQTVADALGEHGIGVCMSDAASWPLWDAVTSDLVYIRLHGHTRTYASAYSTPSLRRWAESIDAWLAEGRRVHVYFDNDAEGAAPRDALRLLTLCERPGVGARAAPVARLGTSRRSGEAL